MLVSESTSGTPTRLMERWGRASSDVKRFSHPRSGDSGRVPTFIEDLKKRLHPFLPLPCVAHLSAYHTGSKHHPCHRSHARRVKADLRPTRESRPRLKNQEGSLASNCDEGWRTLQRRVATKARSQRVVFSSEAMALSIRSYFAGQIAGKLAMPFFRGPDCSGKRFLRGAASDNVSVRLQSR